MYLFVIAGALILVLVIISMVEPDFWISYRRSDNGMSGLLILHRYPSERMDQSINDLAASALSGNAQSMYTSGSIRKYQENLLERMDVTPVLRNINAIW